MKIKRKDEEKLKEENLSKEKKVNQEIFFKGKSHSISDLW